MDNHEDEIIEQNSDGFQSKEQERQAWSWEKSKAIGLTNARMDYNRHVAAQKRNALRALDALARKLGKQKEINHNTYGLNVYKEDK